MRHNYLQFYILNHFIGIYNEHSQFQFLRDFLTLWIINVLVEGLKHFSELCYNMTLKTQSEEFDQMRFQVMKLKHSNCENHWSFEN